MRTLLALGLMVPAIILRAVTAWVSWNWIIAKIFNLIPISLTQAAALSVAVAAFVYQTHPENDDQDALDDLLHGSAMNASLLLVAFIWSYFV